MHYKTITEVSEMLIEEHMQSAINSEHLEVKNFFLAKATGAKSLWSELMQQSIILDMNLDKINEKRRHINENEKLFSELIDKNRVFSS